MPHQPTKKRLVHIFDVLRLKPKDRKVYSALIELRQATASQVARKLKLPRQTTHSILIKLRVIGLVSLSSRSGVKLFIADPEDIHTVIRKRQEELTRVNAETRSAIPYLKQHQRKHFMRPVVRYYDGSFGLKNLFGSMLDYYEAPGAIKEFRGYGLNTYKNASARTYLSHFIKKRSKRGVKTKLMIGAGPEDFTRGKGGQLDISIKHMGTKPQNAGFYILEDKVYLFSFTDNAGLVVENKAIAKFLKDTLDDHWKKTT
jgi:sugar-specific transcriptional regulator TrmB